MTSEQRTRTLDVVVYGATGFVGRLVAEYLARSAPGGTRIGLAGRSIDRLERVRAELGPAAADWPLLRADAKDEQSLRDLAAATQWSRPPSGRTPSKGCRSSQRARKRERLRRPHRGDALRAGEHRPLPRQGVASGARIVHSCGFDSIPSDLGVHVLHRRVQADGAGGPHRHHAGGHLDACGVSGGTIDSLRTQLDATKRDAELRRITVSPYSLSPDRAAEPDLGRQPDMALVRGSDIRPGMAGWKAPFFMGPYNTRVVRRSNALSGYAYGKHFRYREVMNVGSSFVSPVLAGAVAAGMGALVGGLLFPPTVGCSIVCCPSRERDRARRRGAAATSRSTCTATRRPAPATPAESPRRATRVRGDGGHVRRVGAGVGRCSATSYPIVPASSPRDRDGRRAGRPPARCGIRDPRRTGLTVRRRSAPATTRRARTDPRVSTDGSAVARGSSCGSLRGSAPRAEARPGTTTPVGILVHRFGRDHDRRQGCERTRPGPDGARSARVVEVSPPAGASGTAPQHHEVVVSG